MAVMRPVILCVFLYLHLILPAVAQDTAASKDTIVFVEKTLKKISKNVNFTIAPGPVVGTSQKLGFVVLPMLVYSLNKKDSISPPSSSALLVYFDLYGSWVAAVKQSFYWDRNKWRAFISLGVGDLRLKYFGVGRDTMILSNNDSNYVWTRQKELDVSVMCFRKIFKGLYGGLEVHYNQSDLEGTDSIATVQLTRAGLPLGKITQTVLVPALIWDSRDNIFWSAKGIYSSLNCQVSNRAFFSSRDYNIVSCWVNGYHSLLKNSNKLILAWHLYSQAGWGDLPYRIYANYGHGDNVTGYTSGKYVNFSEATVQTELRFELWKFIACGGYAGTGKVFSSYSVFGQSAWLHFGGIRLYFNIIPYRNIRLRLDAAISRKDYGFYIGIGQGF
jgi:hypothetical protein